jgi:beta-lactamase regulating signal transducer with metallopeptidase domain/tetratricopeptide (TPR) repeat protein
MNLLLVFKLTAILAIVGIVVLALRGRSAAVRHRAAVLGLATALALPLTVRLLPSWELPVLPASAPHRPASSPATPLKPIEPGSIEPGALEPGPELQASERKQSRPVADGETAAAAGVPAARTFEVRDGLVALWALGAALVLLRLGAGWFRVNRIALDASPIGDREVRDQVEPVARSLGVRRLPRVLVSDELRVPVLWGFLSPTLILPVEFASWSADRLRVVLTHELAHLRRCDGLSLLIGRLASAAWWFHPLVWLLERRARQECESACDEIVLASGARPSDYAEHLLDIARSVSAATPIPAEVISIMGPGQLEKRLQSILRPGARPGLRPRLAIGLCAIALTAFVTIAGADPVARPQASGSSPDAFAVQAVGRDAAGPDEILLAHDEHDGPGEAAFGRASKLHAQERWAEAAASFEEAADAGYHVGTSLYNAACGHARMGDAAAAVDLLERAIDAGFDNLGHMMKDSDLDPIRRDAAFRSMIERLGDDGRLGRKRGYDKYQSAVDRYEDLRATGSTQGKAWYEVGSALLSLRDFDRATDALHRAAENLPNGKQNALYNLACAYSLAGQSGAALDALEEAVLAGFDSDERFENDSDLDGIRDTKRFAEIEELHDTLSLDRYRSGFDWGSEYSARRWEPAVEDLQAFVARRPDVGRAWNNLGWALHHSRRYAEAREAFTRQLELEYRPGLATYNIACTYAMEGDTEAALEWLGRAVDLESVSSHHLIGDNDLESLRDDPRFERLVEQLAESEAEREGGYHEMFEKIKRKVAHVIHES